MAAHAKFLFDNDFLNGDRRGRASSPRAEARDDIVEAEARGYTKGYAAAKLEGTEIESQIAAALTRSAAGIADVAARIDAVEARLEADSVAVAGAVARALATKLIEQEPWPEIAALVTECLRHLIGVPHVVVRVSDGVYETAQAKFEEIAQSCGFAGRLAVIADSDLAPGDAKVEWTDGGAVRDRARTDAIISEAVDRFIAARQQQLLQGER
jgi:flagellar assembly protein FliH